MQNSKRSQKPEFLRIQTIAGTFLATDFIIVNALFAPMLPGTPRKNRQYITNLAVFSDSTEVSRRRNPTPEPPEMPGIPL